MVGHTIAIHDGRKHVPGVHHREHGGPQARVSSPRRGPTAATPAPTGPPPCADEHRRPATPPRSSWRPRRYVRMSARKGRLVADLVRGKPVAEAQAILAYSTRAAAVPMRKVCSRPSPTRTTTTASTRASCVVERVTVDEGPTIRRFRPRAQGPRDAHHEAHLPHHDRHRRDGARVTHGSEDQPHRLPPRHPQRLAEQLVLRARLRGVPGRGPARPRPHHAQAQPRRPVVGRT